MANAVQIIANSIRAALDASELGSERQLALKAGVAPNTVKNVLKPKERASNKRGDAAPRLDVLQKLADALGFPLWEMLSPGFDPRARQVVMRREQADAIARAAQALTQVGAAYATTPPQQALHQMVLEASRQNPPPAPAVVSNVLSLKRETHVRLSRGPKGTASTSAKKTKK